MKLITCTCLFLTLLSLSNAYMPLFGMDLFRGIADQQAAINAQVQRNIDRISRQAQQQSQYAMASGGSMSASQGSTSNQQSVQCTNGVCTICVNQKCRVCRGDKCVDLD